MLPKFALAVLQYLVRSGALYEVRGKSLDAIPGRHFGDRFAWDHLVTIFDLFEFDIDDESDRMNIIFAGILALLMVARAIMGTEGSFRLWCAIYEAANSGVRVDFPEGSEPVAVLKSGSVDAYPGWDEYFPHYNLWVLRTLEGSVHETRAMRYWQQASLLPETSYPRIAVAGFLKVMHEGGGRSERLIDGYGDVYDSVVYDVVKHNRLLLRTDVLPAADTQTPFTTYFGDPTADPAQGAAWSNAMVTAIRSPLGREAHYPIKGKSVTQLAQLHDIQRYGFKRQPRNGDPSYIHYGTDLPADNGTPIEAMYAGRVVAVQGDQTEADRSDSRGNFVMIESRLPKSGDQTEYIRHEYYHMAEVVVKAGDDVEAGQVIGTVGDTGNSNGDHLHLAIKYGKRDRSTDKTNWRFPLNPERVLELGAVRALSEAGVSPATGSPRPHLAVPLFILGSVSGSSYASPLGVRESRLFDQLSQQYSTKTPPPSGGGQEPPQPKPPVSGAPSPSEGEGTGQGGPIDDAKKQQIANIGMKALRAIGPSVVSAAVSTALLGAGVPQGVAQAIGSLVAQALSELPATGSPQDVVAHVEGRLGTVAADTPIDEIRAAWPHGRATILRMAGQQV